MPVSTSDEYDRRKRYLLARHLYSRANHLPWEYNQAQDPEEQTILHDILRQFSGAIHIGSHVFISPDAHIHTERFSIDDNSYVAAQATIRENVTIGRHTSVNTFAIVAGKVSIGNEVMIASGVSIFGANHGYARRDIAMSAQPMSIKGIFIEDGVWIGTRSVILDGVTVGRQAIVGAGAVVTTNVPSYSIVGGNPARVIKMRP